MDDVVEKQLWELTKFMPLTELQRAFIKVTLEITFQEGEAEQMRKQLKDLKK